METDFNKFLERINSCDINLIIPSQDFGGIQETADKLEDIYNEHPEIFWNVRSRNECDADNIFIGLVIQAIKIQGNMKLMRKIPNFTNLIYNKSKLEMNYA